MTKNLMIDYRNNKGNVCRKVIDDMEFCVREGHAYFISGGIKYSVPLEDVIQMYTN